MSTAPADVREVLLATIRQRLLDDDVHVMRLDAESAERHTTSIAEHAIEAAVARGADLGAVYSAAAIETVRIKVDGMNGSDHLIDPDDGLFDAELDSIADRPFAELGFEPPPDDDLSQIQTLNEMRRSQTTSLVWMLVSKLQARAMNRVRDVYVERLRERGLRDAAVDELIDGRELVALFTAGLYGEEPPAA